MGCVTNKVDYSKIFVADFETSVYYGQENTEVWSVALHCLADELKPERVKTGSSIEDFLYFVKSLFSDTKIYFHNLKFDGSFILSYMLENPGLCQPAGFTDEEGNLHFYGDKEARKMAKGKTLYYTYLISDMGQWYNIKLYTRGGRVCITILDSLKLLPFSVRQIGKAFNTRYQKSEMEYTGERHAGYVPTPDEMDYIKKDVLVMSEALKKTFEEGHSRTTIGSCCMEEFKAKFDKVDLKNMFPNLYDENHRIDAEKYGSETMGDYVRKSYRGGWCYLVRGKEGEYGNLDSNEITGTTCDVNSLYPSMMHSESGNFYPIGNGRMFSELSEKLEQQYAEGKRYFFIRIKTRFYIKPDMLPTIMIKDSLFYPPREWLDSSDYVDANGKSYREIYLDTNGRLHESYSEGLIKVDMRPILTLTCSDYYLLLEHYNIEDFEILDGVEFRTVKGLFDEYIDHYAEIKKTQKGALRTLAKLFLNNLYGKFATSTDSSYNIGFLNDAGELRFYSVTEFDKTPGYIPIGSAITSYARRFTITAAQKNFHGVNVPGFIYADTDSIHCDLLPDEIQGAPEDPADFCKWKYESQWNYAKFLRAKRYTEHVIGENREPVEPHFNFLCAGLSQAGKDLFLHTIFQDLTAEEFMKLDKSARDYYLGQYTAQNGKKVKSPEGFDDLKKGLIIPGILKARHIKGGTLLVEREFTMRD